MSYDIYFRCTHCKRRDDDRLNYTYNLAEMFRWALGGNGLRDLDGLTGAAAVPLLKTAIAKCEADDASGEPERALSRFDAPNGWGSGAGALEFMQKMLGLALANPDDVIDVS